MPNRFLKSFACSGLPRSVQTTVYFLDRWPQIKCNVTLYLHLFLIQFFMLFHMVASVLLSMVAFPTTFLLVETLQQPVRSFEISGYWSYHGEQNAGYHVKEHIKLYQKHMSKVTLHFVWGHISKKQTVKHNRCPLRDWSRKGFAFGANLGQNWDNWVL